MINKLKEYSIGDQNTCYGYRAPSNWELMEKINELVEEVKDGDYDRIKVKEVTDEFFLVKRMREAQKDVIYKSMFSALDSARPTAYEVAKTKQIVLEQEVDEYLKKMEI